MARMLWIIYVPRETIPLWIFVDMNMPLMSGKECLIEIRKITSLDESDVYIYSTAASPGMPDEVFNLGAKDFLLKPVEFKKLVNLLVRNIYFRSVIRDQRCIYG